MGGNAAAGRLGHHGGRTARLLDMASGPFLRPGWHASLRSRFNRSMCTPLGLVLRSRTGWQARRRSRSGSHMVTHWWGLGWFLQRMLEKMEPKYVSWSLGRKRSNAAGADGAASEVRNCQSCPSLIIILADQYARLASCIRAAEQRRVDRNLPVLRVVPVSPTLRF